VNAVPPSGVAYPFSFVVHAVTEDLYLAAETLQGMRRIQMSTSERERERLTNAGVEKMEWVNTISQMIVNLPGCVRSDLGRLCFLCC
jgi:hypothetical protein